MEIRVKIEVLNEAGVVVQDATLLDIVGLPEWARPEDGFLGDVETETLRLIDAAVEQSEEG